MPIITQPVPAIIASGTSLSPLAHVHTGRIVGFQMPAAWDAAALTFQASYDAGATFGDMYDEQGIEIAVSVVASRYVLLTNTRTWLGVQVLKIRSGTGSVPVNQTADRTIQILTVV